MRTLLLSAGMALGLGMVALAPAEAAPLATRDVIVAPAATGEVDCRVVKRTSYRNGVKRVVTTRECDRFGRDRVYERRVVRPGWRHYDRRPGVSIRVN